MSKRKQLNLYIQQVQRRLRLDAGLRGAAVVTLAALAATIILTLILNAYAFPAGGLTPARLVLRAQIVLQSAAGHDNKTIAQSLSTSWPLHDRSAEARQCCQYRPMSLAVARLSAAASAQPHWFRTLPAAPLKKTRRVLASINSTTKMPSALV